MRGPTLAAGLRLRQLLLNGARDERTQSSKLKVQKKLQVPSSKQPSALDKPVGAWSLELLLSFEL
jgi:hypothetical protein